MLVRMENELRDEVNLDGEQVLKQAAVDFGRRVRQFRKAAGLTQQQLAERLSEWGRSYHQTTVAKLEAGNRPTTLEELIPLAAALGVSQRQFFEEPSPADQAEHKVREVEQELSRLRSELDRAQSHYERLRKQFERAVDLYSRRVDNLREFDMAAAGERTLTVSDLREQVRAMPHTGADAVEDRRQERFEREQDRLDMIDAGEAEYSDHYPRID